MAQEFDSIDATIADLEARIAAMTEAVAALRKAKDALGLVGNVGGSSVRRGTADIQIDQFVGKSIASPITSLVVRPSFGGRFGYHSAIPQTPFWTRTIGPSVLCDRVNRVVTLSGDTL